MALCHVATVISLGDGRTLVDDSNSSLYLPPVGRQNFQLANVRMTWIFVA